jgi:transposase
MPSNHPLRLIRGVADEAPKALDAQFAALYSEEGRPSIPPEHLLRSLLLQAFYTIRSERQLMGRRCLARTVIACWRAISPRRSWTRC